MHPEKPKPNGTINRVGDVLGGIGCIVIGVAILCGLALLGQFKPTGFWQGIGFVSLAMPYSLIGELFVLIGMRALMGPNATIDRVLRHAKARVLILILMLVSAVILVGIAILVLW